ncbi:MAG: BON domain-containing protein [Pseudomonadales bacterium]|nr:BON domain-containing protein [Pseudomonadales bacterium]
MLNYRKLFTASLISGSLLLTGTAIAGEKGEKPNEISMEIKQLKEDVSQEFEKGMLQGKLQAAYALNSHLSVFDIDSSIEGNTAILSGTVKTDVEKELAKHVALGVDGINDVTNDIVVDAKIEPSTWESSKDTISETFTDAKITAMVKTKIAGSSVSTALNVDVDTSDQVVTLSGEVASDEHKALAEQIAKNADGVVHVENKLTVESAS